MIKKSFLCFFIFLVLHIILRDVLLPDTTLDQAPWQMNQFRAQEYLYSEEQIDNVLTGSSISFLFDTSFSSNSIYNASLTGESSLKGIEMIATKGKHFNLFPQYILVEMNTLDRYQRSTFEETLYNPFLMYPRKLIPALRDGKQPLVFAAVLMEKYITPHIIPHRYTWLEEKLSPKPEDIEDVFDKKDAPLPNERLRILQLSKEGETEIENRLTKSVDYLIENGSKIIFFEAPVSEEQRISPKYNAMREIIERNYPSTSYPYIENPLDSNFQTSDGIHLSAEDNPRYTRYLFSKVDSLIRNNSKQQ